MAGKAIEHLDPEGLSSRTDTDGSGIVVDGDTGAEVGVGIQ